MWEKRIICVTYMRIVCVRSAVSCVLNDVCVRSDVRMSATERHTALKLT